MQTFNWYTDAALTALFSGTLLPTATDQDYVLYFGSTTASRQVQANTDPGIDQITLTPTDSAGGSGHPNTDIKLALTSGALGSATGGAALNLGVTLLSEVANATPVYIRLTDSTGGASGVSTELSIVMNNVIETAV